MSPPSITTSLKSIFMLDKPVARLGGLSVGAIALILVVFAGYSIGKDAAFQDNHNDRIARKSEMGFTHP